MPSLTPFQRYSRPTPVEDAGTRTHVYKDGETLTLLADRFYGDVELWRDIADYNGVTDPRTIAAGTRLLIPPRRLQSGRFESI
jgi:nucleoid-associated protein YgaU